MLKNKNICSFDLFVHVYLDLFMHLCMQLNGSFQPSYHGFIRIHATAQVGNTHWSPYPFSWSRFSLWGSLVRNSPRRSQRWRIYRTNNAISLVSWDIIGSVWPIRSPNRKPLCLRLRHVFLNTQNRNCIQEDDNNIVSIELVWLHCKGRKFRGLKISRGH